MPLDHTGLAVPATTIAPLEAFLLTALAPLALRTIRRIPIAPGLEVLGMGEERTDIPPAGAYFWLYPVAPEHEAAQREILKAGHHAFSAQSAAQVREFHANAMAAGAVDEGQPGFRTHYHEGYYAAFVRDPVLEIKWEVVCRKGGEEEKVGS